jgi:hypothetical protein
LKFGRYLGFKAWEIDNLRLTNAIDIQHGKVSWEYLGDLLEHVFYDELRVDPLSHPVSPLHSTHLVSILLTFYKGINHRAS